MKFLPHRYPFLLVDKIVEIDGDNKCIGIKNVTINEPFFIGHFPKKPIMPGVLIVEAMAQTAGAMCIVNENAGTNFLVYFMTIDDVKFRKPVIPGDRIELHVEKLKRRQNIWKFSCIAKVDNEKVAEAKLGAMLVEA